MINSKRSYICSAATMLEGHFKDVPLFLLNSTNAFCDDPTVCQPYIYIDKSLFGLSLLPTRQNSFASLLHPTHVYECPHTTTYSDFLLNLVPLAGMIQMI